MATSNTQRKFSPRWLLAAVALLATALVVSYCFRHAHDDENPRYNFTSVRQGSNGRWVAVATNGEIVTSVDGVKWEEGRTDTAGYSSTIRAVCEGLHGRWVAVGDQCVTVSDNGIDWHSIRLSGCDLLAVAQGTDGRWVAVGERATVLTSLDGEKWKRCKTPPEQGSLTSVVAGRDGRWVLVGEGNIIWASTDGTSWGWVPPYIGVQ